MSLFEGGFEVGKLPRETRLFINNEWVEGHGTKFNTVNPKDETVIASMDSANAADVDKAVDAATAAFKKFSKSNGCDRRDMLLRLASLVEKHRAQLAELESLDNGKPVHVADGVDIGCALVPCSNPCQRSPRPPKHGMLPRSHLIHPSAVSHERDPFLIATDAPSQSASSATATTPAGPTRAAARSSPPLATPTRRSRTRATSRSASAA